MKKIVIFSLAAMAAIITSCSSADEFGESGKGEQGNVKVTLTASMPSASTRTTLTDGTGTGLTQTWKSGDGIKVINSSKSNDTQTFTTTSTTATGSFTGTLTNPADNDQLYALYPSSLSMTGTAATVDYSAQDGTLAGVASKAVMYSAGTYSTSKTDLGTFKNAGAILRLQLTFPDAVSISSVKMMANGLVNKEELTLSGTGTAAWANPTNGAMTATLTTAQSFAASTAGYVYFAAIPQTGLEGVSIFATTADGVEYSCQLAATAVHFDAGKVHTLTAPMTKEITYLGTESAVKPIDIDNDGALEMMTAGNFKWLQDDANLPNDVNNFSLNCKMMKNMTINNRVNWIPIGHPTIGATTSFRGTFDGNNKTVSGVNITGEYVYGGFFGIVEKATIQNLNVTGGTIALSGTNSSYVGGLIGQATGNISILGCTSSYNSLTCTNSDSSVGGMIGHTYSQNDTYPVKIFGCKSVVTTGITADYSAGGLSGEIDGSGWVTVMHCISNCQKITTTGSGNNENWLGGIAGYSGTKIDAKGCISILNSVQTTASPNNTYAGTLLGGFSGVTTPCPIDNCYWKTMTSPTSAIGYGTNATITNSNSVATISEFNDATLIANMNAAATATSGYHFEAGTGDNLPTIVKNE